MKCSFNMSSLTLCDPRCRDSRPPIVGGLTLKTDVLHFGALCRLYPELIMKVLAVRLPVFPGITVCISEKFMPMVIWLWDAARI